MYIMDELKDNEKSKQPIFPDVSRPIEFNQGNRYVDDIISANSITPGSLKGNFKLAEGSIFSRDYNRTGTGWILNADGTINLDGTTTTSTSSSSQTTSSSSSSSSSQTTSSSSISTTSSSSISTSTTILLPSLVLTSRALNAVDGDQVIAHGLGKQPSYIRITALFPESLEVSIGELWSGIQSFGISDGTNHKCVYNGSYWSGTWSKVIQATGNAVSSVVYIYVAQNSTAYQSQSATAVFDSTNITLTWDYGSGGSPTFDANIMLFIEAY